MQGNNVFNKSPSEIEGDTSNGFSGRSWDAMKTEYARRAAKIGDPQTYLAFIDRFADLEKQKVDKHLSSALALSQQGNQADAAKQLEAAGYYMHPDVQSKVQPGPRGSFGVINRDATTGAELGGYALTPQSIAETRMAYQDAGGYAEFAFSKQMEMMNQERAERQLQGELAERQTRMGLNQTKTQREQVRLASDELSLAMDRAKAPGELERDRLETQQARDDAVKSSRELASRRDEAFKLMRESIEKHTMSDDDELASLVGGRADGLTEQQMQDVAYNPFLDVEEGRIVENQSAVQLGQDVIRTLDEGIHGAGDQTLTDKELATTAWNLAFSQDSSFEFQGGGDRPTRLTLDGSTYYFDDTPDGQRAAQQLENMAVQSRVKAMQNAGGNPEAHLVAGGRGWNVDVSAPEVSSDVSAPPGQARAIPDTDESPRAPGQRATDQQAQQELAQQNFDRRAIMRIMQAMNDPAAERQLNDRERAALHRMTGETTDGPGPARAGGIPDPGAGSPMAIPDQADPATDRNRRGAPSDIAAGASAGESPSRGMPPRMPTQGGPAVPGRPSRPAQPETGLPEPMQRLLQQMEQQKASGGDITRYLSRLDRIIEASPPELKRPLMEARQRLAQ